jgi:DNA-directed RNA polymerase subunit RPC12/RpoP
MPSTRTDPLFSVGDIGVFPCAKCGKPMRLSCIEPAEAGFDVRTFECEKCNHKVKFAVSI